MHDIMHILENPFKLVKTMTFMCVFPRKNQEDNSWVIHSAVT